MNKRRYPWSRRCQLAAVLSAVAAFTACSGEGEPAATVAPISVSGTALAPLTDTTDVAVGAQAPVLTGVGYNGEPATTAPDARAKLLIFAAHWCPHCNDEIPRVIEMRGDGTIPSSLDVLLVSTAEDSQRPNYPARDWLGDIGWSEPTLVDTPGADGDWIGAAEFGVTGFPFAVLLDIEGRVITRWSGERPPDAWAEYLAAAR